MQLVVMVFFSVESFETTTTNTMLVIMVFYFAASKN
jgi:hypothetical protein